MKIYAPCSTSTTLLTGSGHDLQLISTVPPCALKHLDTSCSLQHIDRSTFCSGHVPPRTDDSYQLKSYVLPRIHQEAPKDRPWYSESSILDQEDPEIFTIGEYTQRRVSFLLSFLRAEHGSLVHKNTLTDLTSEIESLGHAIVDGAPPAAEAEILHLVGSLSIIRVEEVASWREKYQLSDDVDIRVMGLIDRSVRS
ncbi:hypothetical protein F2Q69_00042344 [Brassica cretica]|uniref:Uncharacterized protein n=1 Tax=Brassica cretica TaxID=69181 RepID=A0A8S9NJX2_BRACR|nr:hypothetical protein F2Q69_00042344 [Brassica cretica]